MDGEKNVFGVSKEGGEVTRSFLSSFELVEKITPNLKRSIGFSKILHWERTENQEIIILETLHFGKILLIDRIIQLAERDEFLYHESLVHPAMVTHPNPERVLILGGGDGMALREALKHPSVERAVVVDFDERVIEISKRYFPGAEEAFQDPRSEIAIVDGVRYVEDAPDFQVVILDVTDEEDPHSKNFYTKEFLYRISQMIGSNGVFTAQAGTSAFISRDVYVNHIGMLRGIFEHVNPYSVHIPSFGVSWGFSLSSQKYDMKDHSPEEVDVILSSRGVKTKFYDGALHYYLARMRHPI
jgi:spermidine synthase